jgi:cytochrome P450
MSFNRAWPKTYPEIPKSLTKKDVDDTKIPNGPRTKSFGGNLKKLALYGPKFFFDIQKEYGNAVSFYINGKLFIALFDPSMIHEVYVTKQKSFIKGVIFRKIRMMLGDALLTSENPTHLKHKRMIQPAFHKNKIENYINIMFESTKEQSNKWKEKEQIDLYPEVFKITLKIVAKSLFGLNSEKYEQKIYDNSTISSSMSATLTLFNFVPLFKYTSFLLKRKYKKASNDLNKMVIEIIEEKSVEKEGDDLLSMLLMAEDEDGKKFTKNEVRDETLGILLTGHETTAVTLTWAMMWLSSSPKNLKLLREEALNQEWIKEDRAPTIKEIMQTSFVDNVINETLRLSSPSWISMRQAIEDVYVDNVFIPKGTHVITSQYVTHRDKRYYSNATRWNPERWENNFQDSLPSGAYFPFSMGPRRCIGDQFAMIEMKIILLFLAHHFSWKSIDGSKKFPQVEPKVTLRPKGEVPVNIKKNQHSML